MDIVSIISSVSKIAILAFAITLAVVLYEVFTLMKKNRDKHVVQDHVDIPDFNQDLKAEQHFTQLPNTQAAPLSVAPKGLPKPVLLGVGILTIILLTAGGMWIFTKNRVKSTKTAKDVSPIADAKITPTGSKQAKKPSPTPFPTLRTLPTGVSTPSLTLTPSSEISPSGSITGTASQPLATPTTTIITGSQQKGGNVITATPTISALASATATLKPTVTLPQAGSFQTSLVLVVVSVTLIYLALLL